MSDVYLFFRLGDRAIISTPSPFQHHITPFLRAVHWLPCDFGSRTVGLRRITRLLLLRDGDHRLPVPVPVRASARPVFGIVFNFTIKLRVPHFFHSGFLHPDGGGALDQHAGLRPHTFPVLHPHVLSSSTQVYIAILS